MTDAPPSESALFGQDIPFARFCGIRGIWHEPGHTKLGLTLRPELTNSHGNAHGGVLLTLLDISLATAARTLSGLAIITIDLQTAFLSPGRGELVGEGRVVRAGRSFVFCEGEVRDATGTLVAKATGHFMPVGKRPERATPDAPQAD